MIWALRLRVNQEELYSSKTKNKLMMNKVGLLFHFLLFPLLFWCCNSGKGSLPSLGLPIEGYVDTPQELEAFKGYYLERAALINSLSTPELNDQLQKERARVFCYSLFFTDDSLVMYMNKEEAEADGVDPVAVEVTTDITNLSLTLSLTGDDKVFDKAWDRSNSDMFNAFVAEICPEIMSATLEADEARYDERVEMLSRIQ